MKKFMFGLATGIAVVLVVQSPPMAPIRDGVRDYILGRATVLLDDFVDTYVEERDKLEKKNDETTQVETS